MLPVVALVGRPNVGKSTLFNRLTRTRDALVADFPGLTRDRKYGQARSDDYEFIVVDTGGIDGSETGIEVEMAEQSLLAIEEADVVLFLVDARAGMTVADQAIADHLRKQDKTILLVANKTDGIDADSHCAEFYQLSLGEVFHIAASHGRGVTSLIEIALQPVIEEYNKLHGIEVNVLDVSKLFDRLGSKQIACFKLNIEGAEYEVLERIISINKLEKCDSFLIQFHRQPQNYQSRYFKIKEDLEKTHNLIWGHEMVWEKWVRKGL